MVELSERSDGSVLAGNAPSAPRAGSSNGAFDPTQTFTLHPASALAPAIRGLAAGSMNPPPSRVSGDADGYARRAGRAGDRDGRKNIDKLILLIGDQVVEQQVLVIED